MPTASFMAKSCTPS